MGKASRVAGHELDESSVFARLREFLAVEVLDGDDEGLDELTPLLEWGIIDSLVMVNLLRFVEEEWGVRVLDEDVKPEHFADLHSLTQFLLDRVNHDAEATDLKSIHDEQVRALTGYGIERGVARIHGAEMCYLETEGEGPTWVFLPALGGASSAWGGILRTIAGERRAIALDLAGFGVSKARTDAPAFLDHLELMIATLDAVTQGPLVLIGSSAGSMLAVEYAKRFPDRVHALVVTSFGAIADPAGWSRRLSELARDPDRFLDEIYYKPPMLTSKLRFALEETLARPAYASFLDERALASLPALFDGVSVPTLFVSGQSDRVIPSESVEAAARAIPGAQLEWLARCGHLPHAEQPQELLHLIELFLAARAAEGRSR